MADSFDEARDVMGKNAFEIADNSFEDLSPLAAMEKLRVLVTAGGDKALNTDPKSLQLIRSVARLTDDQINAWVNLQVPRHNPEELLFFDNRIRDYRDKCLQAMKLDAKKPLKN